MNYELAKKLKDAGFPQKEVTPSKVREAMDYEEDDVVTYPTLSELIEACGSSRKGDLHDDNMEGTFILEYFDNHGWHAGYRGIDDGDMVYMLLPNDSLHFKTPIEAVANLWLSVNRK